MTTAWIDSLKNDLGSGREIVETHISLVFIDEVAVYKIKKPVDLGFLDFTTLESRRRACLAEVSLNQRLTADIYYGVLPITREADGRLSLAGQGETVDWAVHMRRLPEECRADSWLVEGLFGEQQIEALAVELARFHDAARCDDETTRYGSLEVIRGNVLENFRQTEDSIRRYLSRPAIEEIESWQLAFLLEHSERFEARCAGHRIRDGHGDLRLEHVYFLPGTAAQPLTEESNVQLAIIDCIEFNDRFRFADVCADIAFLAMDLAWHQRVDLAERLVASYALHANDYDLYPLLDFYESYRAFVRAKVTSFTAASESLSPTTRERLHEEARRYYLLAQASERRPMLAPRVVAVGGLIASGKTTVATAISRLLGAPTVVADRTRKHLLGVEPERKVYLPAFTGAYDEGSTERTYNEVLRRAEAVLDSGRPVVLDASFRSRRLRQWAHSLAERCGVEFLFVECRAPAEVCRQRLEERVRAGSVSDGRLEIFDAFASSWESVEELVPENHLVLDTTRSLVENEALLRRRLPAWPGGAVP